MEPLIYVMNAATMLGRRITVPRGIFSLRRCQSVRNLVRKSDALKGHYGNNKNSLLCVFNTLGSFVLLVSA